MSARSETLTVVFEKGGTQILRWVQRYAYARSGNAHNPTPEYLYELHIDGKFVDQDNQVRRMKKRNGLSK